MKILIVTLTLFEPEQKTMLNTRLEFSDQQGNESMQTVLIMAVGALILIAVNALFRKVHPTIQTHVRAVFSGDAFLSGAGDGGFAFGSGQTSNHEFESYDQSPDRDASSTDSARNPVTGNRPADAFDYESAKLLAGASNSIREMIALELKDHLRFTLPAEAAFLDGVIDDLVKEGSKLDPLSASRRAIEDEISAMRRLSGRDLKNLMAGVEGKIAMDNSISPLLKPIGTMFGISQMVEQDIRNQQIANNPNSTLADAYQAYVNTFRISSGVLADGVLDVATRGSNPSGRGEVTRDLGVQVAIGQAADRAGQAIAESAFPAFNSISHWLYDNGYSPRAPRFPRDWVPPND